MILKILATICLASGVLAFVVRSLYGSKSWEYPNAADGVAGFSIIACFVSAVAIGFVSIWSW